MFYKMLFVVVSVMLDTHPWYQLLGLAAPSVVILIWVLVDKPFRCPDGNNGDMTQGDWHLVLAQALMLLSYGVAGMCLLNSQIELGAYVEPLAALTALAILLTQLVALGSAFCDGGDGATSRNGVKQGEQNVTKNPMEVD